MKNSGHELLRVIAHLTLPLLCVLAASQSIAEDLPTVPFADILADLEAAQQQISAGDTSLAEDHQPGGFAISTAAADPKRREFAEIESMVTQCNCDLESHHAATCPECDEAFSSRFHSRWFGGWIQQGVTLNPANPSNRSNAPVLFNDRSNDYQLNQLYLFLGKRAIADGYGWDWGGRVDLNFGTDSRFVTVPGLEENRDRTQRWNGENSLYGLSLPQAYAELATPLGPNGSTIRAGHFYSRAGFESFAAPENFFYSHSYSFSYGQPFTLTGVQWIAQTNRSAVSVAGTTGWDSFENDGETWAVQAGLSRRFNGDRTLISWTTLAGEDYTGIRDAGGSIDAPRVWTSGLLKHDFTNCLYYVLQADYGRQNDAVVILNPSNSTIGFDDGQWWGISQYMVYQYNDRWSTGLRVEWFRDEGNSRAGIPIEYSDGSPAFHGGDYFAITGGWNFRPIPDVLFRNEIRWDYSDVESNPGVPGGIAGIRPFNDRSDDNQLTIAFDLILLF